VDQTSKGGGLLKLISGFAAPVDIGCMKPSNGLIAGVLVLMGCSAAERCKKINEESFMHRATRLNEDYLLEQIEKKGLAREYALGSPEEQARIRREVSEEPNPFRGAGQAVTARRWVWRGEGAQRYAVRAP
jgi:hypothetical protein